LKEQNAVDIKEKSPYYVFNMHSAMNYDNENDMYESNAELNTNNLHVSLNKILFFFYVFLLLLYIHIFVVAHG